MRSLLQKLLLIALLAFPCGSYAIFGTGLGALGGSGGTCNQEEDDDAMSEKDEEEEEKRYEEEYRKSQRQLAREIKRYNSQLESYEELYSKVFREEYMACVMYEVDNPEASRYEQLTFINWDSVLDLQSRPLENISQRMPAADLNGVDDTGEGKQRENTGGNDDLDDDVQTGGSCDELVLDCSERFRNSGISVAKCRAAMRSFEDYREVRDDRDRARDEKSRNKADYYGEGEEKSAGGGKGFSFKINLTTVAALYYMNKQQKARLKHESAREAAIRAHNTRLGYSMQFGTPNYGYPYSGGGGNNFMYGMMLAGIGKGGFDCGGGIGQMAMMMALMGGNNHNSGYQPYGSGGFQYMHGGGYQGLYGRGGFQGHPGQFHGGHPSQLFHPQQTGFVGRGFPVRTGGGVIHRGGVGFGRGLQSGLTQTSINRSGNFVPTGSSSGVMLHNTSITNATPVRFFSAPSALGVKSLNNESFTAPNVKTLKLLKTGPASPGRLQDL